MLASVLITLVVVGVALYLLTLLPMDNAIRQMIRIVVILGALLYVLRAFGIWHGSVVL